MPTPAGERVASHLPEIHLSAMTRVHTAMRFPPALRSMQMLAVVGWCAAGVALATGGLTAAWVWWLGLAALATIGWLQTSLGIGSGAAVEREARDGDRLERGVVLIAPGGKHMQLRKGGGQYFAVVVDGPPVNRHKPSVDVLFRSVAECTSGDVLAVMLTGMGDDGARGMKQLHDGGARTLAQDEASCVVFGMPKEAIKLGAVDQVLPLDRMAGAILQFDARG